MAKKKKKKTKKKVNTKKKKSVKKLKKKKGVKTPKKKKVTKKTKTKPKKSINVTKKEAAQTKEPWKTAAWGETEVGIVEHFFGEINVAAIKLRKPLKVGDKIHIKGHTTDFSQTVDSIQIEHQSVTEAPSGSDIGIKVKDRVREHDIVYRVE